MNKTSFRENYKALLGGVNMITTYIVPDQIIDAKEEKSLITLTETYNKMIEPGVASKALNKVGEIIPEPIKDFASATKGKFTDNEIFIKSLEVLGKGFQTLEQLEAI